MFKVDKNVPIPPGVGSKYPFLEMEVGDSFSYPSDKQNAVKSYMYMKTKNIPMKFIFRKIGEEYRCWRIK